MLYLPLFIRKYPSGTSRSRLSFKIITAVIIVISILFGLLLAVSSYTFYQSYTEEPILLILHGLMSCLLITARISSFIYYFWFFDFPWYSEPEFLRDLQSVDNRKGCRFVFRHFHGICQCLLVFHVISTLVEILGITMFSYDVNWTVTALIGVGIGGTLHVLIYKLPVYITVIIHSILCLKYHGRLRVLLQRHNGHRVKLMDLLVEYKRIHNGFDEEYNVYLKWTIYCLIANNVVVTLAGFVNVDWNQYIDGRQRIHDGALILNIALYSQYLLFWIVYIVSSSILSESMETVRKAVWKEHGLCIDRWDASGALALRTSMLLFMEKYPVNITIGSLVMTKKNIFSFVATFVVLKIVSLIVRNYSFS